MINDEDPEWVDYQLRFNEIYDETNYSGNFNLQSLVMKAGHLFSEKGIPSNQHFSKVVEVGAGTCEHIKYIDHSYDEYFVIDTDPKVLDVAKGKLSNISKLDLEKIKYDVQDASRLDYLDNTFDRLIAIHVLEHLYYPHLVIKEWQRVVKPGGIITILIPTDPGMLWRFGRYLGPRNKAKKNGIEYDYVMAREHVNSCNNLVSLMKYYFPISDSKWWPLCIPSIDLNLFYVAHLKVV